MIFFAWPAAAAIIYDWWCSFKSYSIAIEVMDRFGKLQVKSPQGKNYPHINGQKQRSFCLRFGGNLVGI